MQYHQGVCFPHSINTSALSCWMQWQTQKTKSALPTVRGSQNRFKHRFKLWRWYLCAFFLREQFGLKSKQDWDDILLYRHYNIWYLKPSKQGSDDFLFYELFYFVSFLSCFVGNVKSFFELLINVSWNCCCTASIWLQRNMMPNQQTHKIGY